MNAYPNTIDIDFDNPTYVLAKAFFNLQTLYGEMLVSGNHMTAASELGVTVRMLGQQLANTVSAEPQFDTEDFELDDNED